MLNWVLSGGALNRSSGCTLGFRGLQRADGPKGRGAELALDVSMAWERMHRSEMLDEADVRSND